MSLTRIIRIAMSHRLREIERFRRHGAQVQAEQIARLAERGRETLYVKTNAQASANAQAMLQNLPIVEYDRLAEWIDRARRGEHNVLWPGRTEWFARSSGTTAKSKYIPVTRDGLRQSHMRGPRDVAAIFSDLHPTSRVFGGKALTLGGSRRIEREGERALTGDLSAILLENTPAWANLRRVPRVKTALIPDFEQKVEAICREAVGQDVRSFAGVPSWNLVMLNKVLEHTGKQSLLEVWPNMELFVHGGIGFAPYRKEYERIIPSATMKYMETYNASEGFFAIADDPTRDDMLLMLDYGTYYEFLPMAALHDPTQVVPLEGVRLGVNYAMIITTSCGLWRCMLGDTVEFTSIAPWRIRITGRTRNHINVFGEEVMESNAQAAIEAACAATGAEVEEYTVAPIFMHGRQKGAHEWVVEFRREPLLSSDPAVARTMGSLGSTTDGTATVLDPAGNSEAGGLAAFARALDLALQSVNSDYEAKRSRNTTLLPPTVRAVPPGTFMRWLASQGKMGGQNKVPRLLNERTLVELLTPHS